MRVETANPVEVVESFHTLSEACPDQTSYCHIIDEISLSSLRKRSAPSELHKRSASVNKVVAEWQRLLDAAGDKTSRPRLGFELIRILQLGSCKGWLTQALCEKISTVLEECKFYDKMGEPKQGYEIFSFLEKHLEVELFYGLPYFHKRFAYIIHKYCRKHFEALKDLPLAEVFIQKKQPLPAPEWNEKRSLFIKRQIEHVFRKEVIRHRDESVNKAIEVVQKEIEELFTSGASLKYPRDFKIPTENRFLALADSGFCCSLNLTDDRQFIDLQVFNPAIKMLCEGGEAAIYRSRRFLIPIEESIGPLQVIDEVNRKPKKEKYAGDFSLSQKLSFEVTERLKTFLPALALVPRRYYGKVNLLKGKGEPSAGMEPKCDFDLYKAAQNNAIALKDLQKVICEKAMELAAVHEIGLIHGDVKSQNILLAQDGSSYLIDWCLAVSYRAALGKCAYFYWDTSRNEGIATPFTDWYGLAMANAELTIPKIYTLYNSLLQCDFTNSASDCILKPFLAEIPFDADCDLRRKCGLLKPWEQPFNLFKTFEEVHGSAQAAAQPCIQEDKKPQGAIASERLQFLCDSIVESLPKQEGLHKEMLKNIAFKACMTKLALDLLLKVVKFDKDLFQVLTIPEVLREKLKLVDVEAAEKKMAILANGNFQDRSEFVKELFNELVLEGKPASEEAFLRLFTEQQELLASFEKTLEAC